MVEKKCFQRDFKFFKKYFVCKGKSENKHDKQEFYLRTLVLTLYNETSEQPTPTSLKKFNRY